MSNQEPEFNKVVKEDDAALVAMYRANVAANVAEAIKELERDRAKINCKLFLSGCPDLWEYKKIFLKELLSIEENMIALVSAQDEVGYRILSNWFKEDELKDSMAQGDFVAGAVINKAGLLPSLLKLDPIEEKKLQEIEGLSVIMVAFGVVAVFSVDELLGLEKVYYSTKWAMWDFREELAKRNPRKKRAYLENLYGNIITGRAQVSRVALWLMKGIYFQYGFISHAVYLEKLHDQYDRVYDC